MSAVIADPAAVGGAPAKGGKKKLIIIVAAALLVVLLAGGGAVAYLRHKAHVAAEAEAAADGEGGAEAAAPAEVHDSHNPPTYLPLDPFVINLADRDNDRYAQVGITLELQSPAFAEQMKAYMPAVRNAILLVITRKTSKELLEPMGKEMLADEIMREAVRPMGIDIAAPMPVTMASASGAASGAASASAAASGAEKTMAHADEPPAKKKHKETVKNPIQHVNFSSFIIQ